MWHIIILNVFIHLNVSYHLVRECVCVCICMEMWGELVQFHYDVCSIWIRWIFPSIQFVQSFAHVFTYNTIQFNVYLMCVCVSCCWKKTKRFIFVWLNIHENISILLCIILYVCWRCAWI